MTVGRNPFSNEPILELRRAPVRAQLRGALRAATVLEPANLTLSVGVAERSDAAASSHALLEAADRALYLAKDCGRDQAVLLPVVA